MNLMTGLIGRRAGTSRVLGVRPTTPRSSSARRLLHAVRLVSARHDRLPVRQLVPAAFSASSARRRAIRGRALERVGLVEAAERKVAGYSKGMRQRIQLAQAIAHDPAVLILDEPLNGLDPMARAEAMRFQAARRRGAVTSSSPATSCTRST